MKPFVTAASLALLLLGPSTGLAAVVYEEVTNLDDLPIDAPYPVLALAPGTNSVLGGTSFSADAVDSFAFSVPAGFELESITYVFTSQAFIRGGGSLTEAISDSRSFLATEPRRNPDRCWPSRTSTWFRGCAHRS